MNQFTPFDQDKADERVAHMLNVLMPHSDALRPLLEIQHNVFLNMPCLDPLDVSIREDGVAQPDEFMSGMLMAKCYEIAIAEQQTKTVYPDDKIFEKVQSDLTMDIAEMVEIERGAGKSRTH